MEINIDKKTFNKMGYFGLGILGIFFIVGAILDYAKVGIEVRLIIKSFILGCSIGYSILMGWIKAYARKQQMEKDKEDNIKKLIS